MLVSDKASKPGSRASGSATHPEGNAGNQCTGWRVGRPPKSTLNAPVEDPKASRTPGGGVEPEGSTPRQGVEEPRGEVDVEPSPKKSPFA